MPPARGTIHPEARFDFVARPRVARTGAAPIFSRIASMNARTFGDGSRVDGKIA